MQIENLKEKLQLIMTNNRLQLALTVGTKRVFEADRADLLRKLVSHLRTGTRVSSGSDCNICRQNLHIRAKHNEALRNKKIQKNRIAVFPCSHIFHTNCLEQKLQIAKGSSHEAYICFVCDGRYTEGYTHVDVPPPVRLAPRGLSEAQIVAARSRLATTPVEDSLE